MHTWWNHKFVLKTRMDCHTTRKGFVNIENSGYHRDILNTRLVFIWIWKFILIETWLFDNIFHFLITYRRITDFSYELNICIDAKPYCSIDKTDYNKTDFYSFLPSLFTLSIFMEIRTIIIRYRDCTFGCEYAQKQFQKRFIHTKIWE